MYMCTTTLRVDMLLIASFHSYKSSKISAQVALYPGVQGTRLPKTGKVMVVPVECEAPALDC